MTVCIHCECPTLCGDECCCLFVVSGSPVLERDTSDVPAWDYADVDELDGNTDEPDDIRIGDGDDD